MRVALTQSRGRLEALAGALRARGFEVVHAPLIRTEAVAGARAEAASLVAADWLLFSSAAGVEAWHALGLSLTPHKPQLGAVGKGTAQVIERFGGRVALLGDPQHAEGLARVFLERVTEAKLVGLPQGELALPTLKEQLEQGGVRTRPVVIYRTEALPWRGGEAEVVVLFSPSAVAALPAEAGARAKLVALGPATRRAVTARGWSCSQAAQPDAAGIVGAIEERLVGV